MSLLVALTLAAVAAPPRNLAPVEKAAIKAAVEEKLKDPFSAQFKWGQWNGSAYYCGTVNAKNSFGGYIGFVPFLALVAFAEGKVAGPPFIMLADADPNSVDSRVVREQCAKGGYPQP